MHAIQQFNLAALINSMVSLTAAFLLGSLIGYERQFRQRTAGLRTNALVAIASAAFVDLAYRLDGSSGATHVAAYVVSGVGFLGAGTIMKKGLNVRGLNTAATLWGSAAVGACAGASMLAEATLAAVFVLATNILLRPVVNSINRKPINQKASELTYQLCVVTTHEGQKRAMTLLETLLDGAKYPVGNLDVRLFGDNHVQMTATLLSTSVDSKMLDRIAARLMEERFIKQAFWNPSTTE